MLHNQLATEDASLNVGKDSVILASWSPFLLLLYLVPMLFKLAGAEGVSRAPACMLRSHRFVFAGTLLGATQAPLDHT
jgi:hypothetical protein